MYGITTYRDIEGISEFIPDISIETFLVCKLNLPMIRDKVATNENTIMCKY